MSCPSRVACRNTIPFPGGGNSDYPLSWSPDDRNLLFMRFSTETRFDLWILPMSGDRPPYPYLQTPVGEFNGRISPDGRWVAYGSNESGRIEVFVQSFPVPGNKRRISTSGGNAPMWRQDGRELYFVTEDHTLMAVSVTPRSAGSLEFSSPSRLFQAKHITGGEADQPTLRVWTDSDFWSWFRWSTTGPRGSTLSTIGDPEMAFHAASGVIPPSQALLQRQVETA